MEVAYAEALQLLEVRLVPRRRVTAPNRLEVSYWDLMAALARARESKMLEQLRAEVQHLLGRRQIFFAPSCRAAIAQVLHLLPQKEVVMPAYTCPVVKTAVQLAGKRIIYVDIAKGSINSMSESYVEQAKPGRILLPTHLFGIPTDIEAICKIARERDCVTVEDAAAAFGSRRGERLLGTFGDFGIFSFERSKRLPAFRGAVIVVNNETLVKSGRFTDTPFVKTENVMPFRELAFALAYKLATIPWIYGRFTLPRLLGTYKNVEPEQVKDVENSPASTPFYRREFHPFQAALVLRMLNRLDTIRQRIQTLVSIYMEVLRESSVATFLSAKCDQAALLRFPVAFPQRRRAEVLRSALRRGLYLETNYELPLPERSIWGEFPNAMWAANNILLLPLYSALAPEDAQRLASGLLEIEKELSRHHVAVGPTVPGCTRQ